MSYGLRSARGRLGARVVVGLLLLSPIARAQVSPSTVTQVSATSESTVDRLRQLSIEELGALKVTSVEKRPEALSDAPAAIYVITHDDIIRSGAVSLPEILRIAPNLQVYQQSAGQWVVTSRGFAGNYNFQSFSNLMLVLIDGRSIYNPVFTGINWDMQDLVPDDIDRVEVISGPAGALWGANAVQGVVNIITRKANDTQGALVDVVGGSQTRALTAQIGTHIGDNLSLRLFARDLTVYDTRTATGGRPFDKVHRTMGGFRADWTPTSADSISVRGDYAEGGDEYPNYRTIPTSSRDLSVRWNHAWSADSTLSLLAYYDRQAHGWDPQGDPYLIDTYDVEGQESFHIGSRNHFVVGAGLRRYAYSLGNTALVWTPRNSHLDVIDAFVQDSVALRRNLDLTLGLKLENDPHSGLSPMPNVRLSWKPRDDLMLWAAASRAIRAPAPFDTDIQEVAGGTVLLHGDKNFQAEMVTAYETGIRVQPSSRLSISASGYYNAYDHLRNIQAVPVVLFPLSWANRIEAHTWGLDIWADWRVTDWWRLTPSVGLLRESFRYKSGASAFLPILQETLDPKQQAQLRSSMDFGHGITFENDVRYVDALPGNSGTPAYVELDSRLGWRITRKLEVSVGGFNLLHDQHRELPAPATEIPRSVRVELRAGF